MSGPSTPWFFLPRLPPCAEVISSQPTACLFPSPFLICLLVAQDRLLFAELNRNYGYLCWISIPKYMCNLSLFKAKHVFFIYFSLRQHAKVPKNGYGLHVRSAESRKEAESRKSRRAMQLVINGETYHLTVDFGAMKNNKQSHTDAKN